MPNMTVDDVERRVRAYFQDCLDKSSELAELLPQDPISWDRDAEVETLHTRIGDLTSLLVSRNFSKSFERDVLEILYPGVNDPKIEDIETFRYACKLVLRAKIEDAKVLAAELMGQSIRPTDPVFQDMIAQGFPPLPGDQPKRSGIVIRRSHTEYAGTASSASITYGELFDSFLKQKENQEVAPKTLMDLKRSYRIASEIIDPTRPINLITETDIRTVRNLILELPVHMDKNPAFRGLSAREAVNANVDVGADRLNYITQQKIMLFFMMPLRWAVRDALISTVPGSGISIPIPRTHNHPNGKRHSYEKETLRRIFLSPLFTGCANENRRATAGNYLFKDGKYWIPIIAFYSGMRLGEVVQLAKDDVKRSEGIWYFDIKPGKIKNADEKKRVKNTSAQRKVPIADELFALGFRDVFDRAETDGRLFPEIPFGSDGTPSTNFSKFWGRYGKAIGFNSADQVFHSLRHNMTDMTRDAKVHIEASTLMMGHTLPSMRAHYGDGMSLLPLKQEMDRIKPPVDLVQLLEEAQRGKIDMTDKRRQLSSKNRRKNGYL